MMQSACFQLIYKYIYRYIYHCCICLVGISLQTYTTVLMCLCFTEGLSGQVLHLLNVSTQGVFTQVRDSTI